MRTAIVYASVHHGNTEKLVKRIAEECQVDLIDAVKQPDVDLSSYNMIGFASGIYFSRFHQSILEFVEKNLPDDKKIFLICTYGGSANYKSIEQILDKKHASVVGKFGCKGYDTFGPFKLVGGIAKGHPNEEDMKKRSGLRKRITLIFEQKENRGFYSSVFWLLCFSLQLEKYLLQALSGNVPAGLQSQERDYVLHVRCGL